MLMLLITDHAFLFIHESDSGLQMHGADSEQLTLETWLDKNNSVLHKAGNICSENTFSGEVGNGEKCYLLRISA